MRTRILLNPIVAATAICAAGLALAAAEPIQPIAPASDADRYTFKVPTLRNVELTYPYFHDGAIHSLTEAVDIMGRLQLGREFTAEENAQIVAFLKTLTGEQPGFTLPVLPPSTEKTPAPRPFEVKKTGP